MSKTYNFDWQIEVSTRLLQGDSFDRWDEENGTLEQNCLFRVDSYGFFIYWQSDGRDGQVIELSQVSDIRPGKAPTDQKIGADLMSNSLVYGRGNIDERTVTICSGIDFVQISHTNITGADPTTAKAWIEGLRKITHNHKANNICPTTILRKHWMKLSFMLNVNKKIPVRSISKTFASGRTEKRIFEILKELGLPSGKNDEVDPADFTFEKFCDLYHKICPRTDIAELFDQLSGGKDYITTKQFVDWLNEAQRDPRLNEILFPFYNTKSALRIIDRYELRANYRDRGHLSCDGLTRYLMSDENAPVFLDRLEVYHDMDQPLCHYLINSSHNTYLQGRQFGGRSSVEMYRQVLLAGCRCIELDCWDGKNDTEPIITHGKAMCSDINFKEVIYAIRDTAFVTSDYPIILSFENHCSKPQQFKLAKYCEEILGDLLLTKPLDSHSLEPSVPLPSPNLLKRKILIKNKRLKPEVEKRQLDLFLKGIDTEGNNDNDVDSAANVEGEDGPVAFSDNAKLRDDDDEAHPELNVDVNDDASRRTLFGQLGLKLKLSSNLSREEEEALYNGYQYKGATTNIHPLLSSRVNYTQPIKFPGFSKAEERNIHYHMSSFSENVALQHLKQNPIEFVNYNKRQLSRIYPKGGRVDSSNYMPQIFWNAGCQMVSLNFQTPDLPMQLNLGKFEYNGNCGYLLKPDFMRRPDRTFDPYAESPVDGVIAAFCSVRVISGQFLSDKKIGTYVEVDMFGLPADTIRKEYRTKTIPTNGLNPRYDETVFEFRKIVLPDLAILRIAVYEETGKLIGQRVLPLDGLQAGYRHISLRTEGNFPLSLPTIFCEIILKSYVPDGLTDFVDQLNQPLLIKKTEELLNSITNTSSDGSLTTSTSSLRRNRIFTDTASASNPSLDTKLATTAASNTSVNTVSTSDGINSAASIKYKALIEIIVPITLECLYEQKSYSKLKHKQDKELILVKKKHAKEQAVLGEQQSKIMSKAKSDTEKATRSPKIQVGSQRRDLSSSNDGNSTEGKTDTKIMDLITEQNVEWTSLVQRQITEMNTLRRQHTKEQCETLRLLLEETQKIQTKELVERQTKEKKELELSQVRQNIEDSKRLGSEKNIRNKSDLDRRVRELKSNNTKKFVEERKRQNLKHERDRDNLIKAHESQKTTLLADIDKMLEYSVNYQDETPMARFPSSSV
ncbi:unnamed protein product [Rotaria magnacalcarata]|uniref:1-phosphatidylinositol 4,5-bisphosphate phosphodiesterase n=1 Tax=Rotaria magnacalcarata TaxID=392030 RepID=A0A819N6U6_9BILA|nr:unnamed protein product [Rotaria magnacalcarata]CAF3990384.1 unnamed protein product [Rotaria magnacalcarata]